MGESKFSNGFLLGMIFGAALVFLLGTKSGKNILKNLSEQGIDGINDLLEEYDIENLAEEEGLENQNPEEKTEEEVSSSSANSPKRRFFRRVKR